MIDSFSAFRNCISEQKCNGCEYGCGGHEQKIPVPLTLCLAICRKIHEDETGKEKKPVSAMWKSRSYQGSFIHGKCPNCNREINNGNNPNFCGLCGQPIKWN